MKNAAPNKQHYHPSLRNLRSLLSIRCVALLSQVGVLAYVTLTHNDDESLTGLTIVLGILIVIAVASMLRCRNDRAVTDVEFAIQLLIDVIGWAALMYVSGGANNPFISYFLVPLVIAAALLPWVYTWAIAGVSLACYTLLLYQYQSFPLFVPHTDGHHHLASNIHILGMWFNFFFSAGLITYFVVKMAENLRAAQARAGERREDTLRNEQIVAAATLAAGTAHELGTPLSTLAVLTEEELEHAPVDSNSARNLQLMQQQIAQCKNTLSRLSETAQLTSADRREAFESFQWLEQRVHRWALRRPDVRYQCQWLSAGNPPIIEVDPTLAQAVENLLDNAANAQAQHVSVTLSQTPVNLTITVVDDGTGIDPTLMPTLGKPVLQSSKDGLGLGLMLSHATVERYGGKIELSPAQPRGTIAQMSLPLKGLQRKDV